MIEPWIWPLLFATGFVAGWMDSIAGGGGLITIPVLLSCGLDPRDALGTNKLQACFGSGSAAWHYSKAGFVSMREQRRGFLITFAAAAAGATLVKELSRDLLMQVIPWLLAAVAIYMLIHPRLGNAAAEPRMKPVAFDWCFGLILGFYDGFFGPGTGTFWAMAYLLVGGLEFTRATANTKVMNFASNTGSLAIFAIAGHVMLLPGLVMGAGQLLGARVGSRTVVKHGAKFIRPIFIGVVLLLVAKLLRDAYRD